MTVNGSFILFLLLLAFLAFAGWVVLNLLGAQFGPSFNRFNPLIRSRSATVCKPALGTAQNEMPTCGRCGYIVRGVNTFECPECGEDLREVGISTPLTRSVVSSRGCAFPLAWTIGILIVSTFLLNQLPHVLPNQRQYQYTANLTPTSNALVAFSVRTDFVRTGHGLGGGGGGSAHGMQSSDIDFGPIYPHAQVVDVAYELHASTPQGALRSPRRFRINIARNTFTYETATGQVISHARRASNTDIADWLVSNGMNRSDPNVADFSDDLFLLMQALEANRNQVTLASLQSPGYQYQYNRMRTESWKLVLIGVTFLVWVAGLYWLKHRPKQN